VGVAGGATRAALTQHQALKDNMADVSAKDGSQETMVNFTALLVSLVLTPAVADKQKYVYSAQWPPLQTYVYGVQWSPQQTYVFSVQWSPQQMYVCV
jgi:hypothetical protein